MRRMPVWLVLGTALLLTGCGGGVAAHSSPSPEKQKANVYLTEFGKYESVERAVWDQDTLAEGNVWAFLSVNKLRTVKVEPNGLVAVSTWESRSPWACRSAAAASERCRIVALMR